VASASTSNRSFLSRGFIALVFLAVFLALAIVLPRLLYSLQPRLGVITTGFVTVNTAWLDNTTLQLNITNNYRAPITARSVSICGAVVWSNSTVVGVNETLVLVLRNVTVTKPCFARLEYSIGEYRYSRLFTVSPPS